MSFKDKTTLSMIPSIQSNAKTIEVKGVKVLKFAAIYGANASGKSNLIKAFTIMERIIYSGLSKRNKDLYCRIHNENKTKPTEFSTTFYAGGKFYNYSFEVILYEGKVLSETLSEINPKTNNAKKIYSYKKGELEASKVFFLKNIDSFTTNRIMTYLFDNSKIENKLFITELINKDWDNNTKLKFIEDFEDWFNSIDINFADRPIDNMKYLDKEDERNRVGKILNELNTGVSEISFVEISKEQFVEETNKSFVEDTLKELSERYEEEQKKEKKGRIVYTIRGDAYYRLSISEKEGLIIKTIRLNHQNCENMFDFGDESDGTKRLFDLLDIVFTSNKNSVYVIDEIERSLHPVLTFKLIQILNEELDVKNIQLIFTTHETHIMDSKLFRRDEIWFMEKDHQGHSKLFSLDIFKTRNEKNIKDGYINGLYGGIPLFKKIED